MQDEERTEKNTGFEYLGPQSEHAAGNLPPLPKRFKVAEPPLKGELPIENYGNVDFHFTWPELEPVDDEWAGKNYSHPGGAA